MTSSWRIIIDSFHDNLLLSEKHMQMKFHEYINVVSVKNIIFMIFFMCFGFFKVLQTFLYMIWDIIW